MLSKRQPNRTRYYEYAFMYLGLAIISGIILIGWFLTPIFSFLALIAYLRGLRYPVIKVRCPHCNKKQKIEPEITDFWCMRCEKIVKRPGDTWE